MAPGFWQTLIYIAEIRKRYCSEIEPCKSKPMDQEFQLSCLAPDIADEVVTTERSHDLKFDKGAIYIVYFHTGSYIRSNCTYVITSCVHVRNLHPGANIHPGAHKTPFT